MKRPLSERFWEKVNVCSTADDCWEWQGLRTDNGYGYLGAVVNRNQGERAHRISYQLHYGPIPLGLCVLHHCDNRLCVNPRHLFLGTRTDNARDRTAKQREARGSALPQSKLNPESVREIRRLYAAGGVTQQELAIRYGVGRRSIGKVVSGQNWAHVEMNGHGST